jgi:hypothetical protein
MRVVGFVGNNGRADHNMWLLWALNGRLPRKVLSVIVTGSEDGIADEDAQFAKYSFSRVLREEMDKWIDSGRTGEVENPWERVAPPLPEIFVRRNPPVLSMDANGPYLIMVPWKEGKNFVESVMDGAFAMFVQFLDSPECRRLFRCDGCGRYFIRDREPKKDMPIKRGSWCAKCKGKGGAKRTANSREIRKSALVELAAEAWIRWKPGNRLGERPDWIVKQVNAKMPVGQNPIKINWVTRHQSRD